MTLVDTRSSRGGRLWPRLDTEKGTLCCSVDGWNDSVPMEKVWVHRLTLGVVERRDRGNVLDDCLPGTVCATTYTCVDHLVEVEVTFVNPTSVHLIISGTFKRLEDPLFTSRRRRPLRPPTKISNDHPFFFPCQLSLCGLVSVSQFSQCPSSRVTSKGR